MKMVHYFSREKTNAVIARCTTLYNLQRVLNVFPDQNIFILLYKDTRDPHYFFNLKIKIKSI